MIQPHDSLFFLGTYDDKSYLPYLKGCVGTAKVFVSTEPISTLYEIVSYCEKRDIRGVITTSSLVLEKLLNYQTGKKPSIDNYAGSLFSYKGLEILIINPLAQLISVPYGKFIASRYISKLVYPTRWLPQTEFNWCILTPQNIENEYANLLSASLAAVDIETYKENLAIRCIGFTSLHLVGGNYVSRSTVLPLDSEWALAWAAKFLDAPCAKILQNGKYDINYLMRYGLILRNYLWDTANAMHSWYSELPKDLATLSAFFIRESMYWKDLAETNDLEQYYLYNAKDTHATAMVFLAWIKEAPDWAKRNYVKEFPVVFLASKLNLLDAKEISELWKLRGKKY